MTKYWKQFEEWVIALKLKPFRNARLKLTALYILSTIVVLTVFVTVLGYIRIKTLREDLAGNLADGINLDVIVQKSYLHLQNSTFILALFMLVAMSILSYFFVRIALRPIKDFMEVQRRFISDASHELRTPLATMKTENEVALLDPESLSKEEAVSVIKSNVEEVNRITTILNNLLNLASFNNVSGAPPFAPLDLSSLVVSVINRSMHLADEKQIKLSILETSPIFVWGNATAIEEIVANLLKNSIQYTPIGGQVSLELRADFSEKKGELIVRDTGIGIPQKDLPYIFEPFYRSNKSLHMHQHGNGLGLPLVREIVKRHGGSIEIKSVVNQGTSVTILLPLASSAEAQRRKS
jgi:signal transduction histidine kinase